MKTIIVPVDFSETSKNAARFAAQVAAQIPDAHIILYNVFDKIESGSDGSVLEDEPEARHQIMDLALESVRRDMTSVAEVPITFLAEEKTSFIDSLERIAKEKNADLIIMGITGSTRLEQILMGSNTLNIVKRNVCPVLIVPPNATFKGIKTVVFATDYKDVDSSPTLAIQKFLDLFNPFVYVVNVDSEHYVEVSESHKAERAKLEKMLEKYEKDFFFIRLFDFVDAISQFATDRNADLILTIPRKHSFLSGLYKSSHTKNLAYHSHIPIVAIHE